MLSIEQYLSRLCRKPAIEAGETLYYTCLFCGTGQFRVCGSVAQCKCGWKGTVTDLIADFEQVDDREAADIASDYRPREPIAPGKRLITEASLLQQQILTQMTSWWHGALFWHTRHADQARLYLLERGVSNAAQLKTVYGYSPADPSRKIAARLSEAINFKYGWTGIAEAIGMGILCQDKEGLLTLRLQDRIVFSCLDKESRQTLYYRARVVEPSSAKCKYLTPAGIKYVSFWEPD
jgi:hypothetical protein